jgi:hypothetical protein
MFYQNSNDLVKNASIASGHVQNSSVTREMLMKQTNTRGGDTTDVFPVGGNTSIDNTTSLSIGATFQNMIQNLVNTFSLKEGIDGAGAGAGPANPNSGIGGNNADQTQFVRDTANQVTQYTEEQLEHITRVTDIMNLINKDNKNSRQKWVEVTDSEDVTKYGYITKDGIFQIWNAPSTPPTTNWLETDKMKQNAGILGCPASPGTIEKIKIAGTWKTIQPFDMVYADNDSGRKNPLFLLVNDTVRDPKNSVNGMGLFSCGNERGNVYVTQRPSADFRLDDPIVMGCYVIGDDVTDSEITNRGFTFQNDLTEASISQCKRRAEDLGSSYFLVSAPQPGKPNNRGGCWIYTGEGEPNIKGILTLNNDETKCHIVGNPEDDEDGFMKAYATTKLKRMYGKNTVKSSTDYTSKGDGLWASEGQNEYTCSGAKGRNTTGNYGDFNRYCIFDKAEDAENWCSSDPTCLGYTNMGNTFYQVTKKKPYVNPHGGTYFEKSTSSKPSQSVSLYSLKKGGPTGVDQVGRNGPGSVGKIAYIDHNGERHEYPASALSFIKPTKENPAKYINLGGYDTRSVESSYSLKEITPGGFSDPTNLLYKASRDGWTAQKFHQLCDNKGATYTRAILTDDRVLGAYISVSWRSDNGYVNDKTAFMYDGTRKYTTERGAWKVGEYAAYMNAGYFPTFGGGHDMHIGGEWMYINAYSYVASDGSAPLNRKGWGAYERHNLKDIEVYSVDAKRFPNNPLEYAHRLRTMPIGESITASMEKCRGLCDDDDNCGGFVYTKSGSGADGKCELKDRTKMYPAGLRVANPTKQLMLKVPTINETIKDKACRIRNGEYATIDTVQYAHYPDTGAMSADTKCNIENIIPKKGEKVMSNVDPVITAVKDVSQDTARKTADYSAQTTVSESFIGFREGMAGVISGINYADTMMDVKKDLTKIANAEYQRERLRAITEESNKLLISESYKFILWSILAILAVMALLKLKEMFGQDDVDSPGDGGEGSGGLFAYILGLFGIGSLNTNDITDRTGDVKEALSSAGEQLKEAGENLSKGITEGADNLVASANEMAAGAMEGAKGLADKVSETATDAVNKIGDAVGNAGTATAAAPAAPAAATGAGTGGGRSRNSGGKKK